MYGIHNFIVRYTDSNSAIGKFIIILIIIVTIAFIAGIYFTFFHDGVVDIRGCRSFRADNYNPRATINDGSCVFSRERSCNNNGDPTTNNNCSCDIGYGSRNCRKEIDYSNVLIESNNVIIDDIRGTMVADELLFDIKKQTLNIASFIIETLSAANSSIDI